jgi:hypothetical protein
MGYRAAYNVGSGSNIIEIGNEGAGADSNVIKIGTQGTQVSAYMAGIYGNPLTGSAVYVTSSGELGVQGSSERFKTSIKPMGSSTEKLEALRPVNFLYKTDSTKTLQYGLIAEEVDKVYPELVIRDDSGKIQGVRYEELAPMLLNELQQEKRQLAAQNAKIGEQSEKLRDLTQQVAELNDVKQELRAALRALQSKELVAQR